MQHSLTFVPTASPTLGDLSPNLEALSQRTCELRKVSCNTHCVRSYACGYAVQPALQIALRLFGQDGKHRSALARGGVLLDSAEGPMREFPGFSRSGTHRSVLYANHLRFFGRTGDAAVLQSVPFCPRLCLARQNGQQTGFFSLLERKRWWLTAGDLSPKLGDLRIFPGFSRSGKCDSMAVYCSIRRAGFRRE